MKKVCGRFVFKSIVLLALNYARLGACSTGLAMFASPKQARANPCAVFLQGRNNHAPSQQ